MNKGYLLIIGLLLAGALILYLTTNQLLAIAQGNDRTTTINGIPVNYTASFGHTQYACGMAGDVTTNDNSKPGHLQIDSHAPNTGTSSCSTYTVAATASLTFDPTTMNSMKIHTTRSTTCTANRPFTETRVNDLILHNDLATDATSTATGGDIIITNTGTSITIETTEGRTINADTTKPIGITMSTSGGNRDSNRMKGCDLHLDITTIETTYQPDKTPTSNNTIYYIAGITALLAVGAIIYTRKAK